MSITWHTAAWKDMEPAMAVQPRLRGDSIVGAKSAIDAWRRIAADPFFASVVLESNPDLHGHRIVGFGCSVMVSTAFADAELAAPSPDINSRIIASVHEERSVLATRKQVAQANAGKGVDIVVLYGSCLRYDVLSPSESHEMHNVLTSGFADWHAGYRMRNILCETADEQAREYVGRSHVLPAVAAFPEHGRVLHCTTEETLRAILGHVGSALFTPREPLLRLRESDQELLLAALGGSIDAELAAQLGVTLSAVKARWRSALARVEDAMPELVRDADDHEGRGMQKRHRVLAYVRSHPEELRPFDWKQRPAALRRTQGPPL